VLFTPEAVLLLNPEAALLLNPEAALVLKTRTEAELLDLFFLEMFWLFFEILLPMQRNAKKKRGKINRGTERHWIFLFKSFISISPRLFAFCLLLLARSRPTSWRFLFCFCLFLFIVLGEVVRLRALLKQRGRQCWEQTSSLANFGGFGFGREGDGAAGGQRFFGFSGSEVPCGISAVFVFSPVGMAVVLSPPIQSSNLLAQAE
jgi:hypothetical protein